MIRPSLRLVALFVPLLASLSAADWRVSMASLLGSGGDQELTACLMADDGVAIVAGSGTLDLPGIPVHDLSGGRGNGLLLRVDVLLGQPLSLTRFSTPVKALARAADGDLFVSAGSIYKLDPTAAEKRWIAGGGGKVLASDGAGGVWSWHGKSADHINADGKQVGSVSLGGKGFAVDPEGERLFVCGFRAGRSKKSGNPVHVPYVKATDYQGNKLWTMWNFTPTQVDEVGDMADSHPQRLCFGPDGYLYMFGDSDGGNTAFRHSPHEPGGKLDGALSGTPFREMWRAFRSVRMLFACKIDPANGDVLRGSFFYGMFFNEEANRKEIGDAQALALDVDTQGRIYLGGVMRCDIPWTAGAVHQASAPIDRKGYWNNKAATDEMYLAIFEADFRGLAYCSGFNQGADGNYHSRAFGVAGSEQGAVVVGMMKKPEHKQDAPASATAYLAGSLQTDYGGGEDGYFATLSPRRPPSDPVALARLLLDRIYPDLSGPAIDSIRNETSFGPAIAQLRAGDERSQMAGRLIERVGEQTLERAIAVTREEPVLAKQQFEQLTVAWAETPVAVQANQQLAALEDDKELRKLMKANEAKYDFLDLADQLVTVDDAEQTFLDQDFLKENGRVLKKMQRQAQQMLRSWPDHRYTTEVLATCTAYSLPISDEDLSLLKELNEIRNIHAGLMRRAGDRQVDWQHEDITRRFRRQLQQIERALETMIEQNPEHAYTELARTRADEVGIHPGKKK